MKSAILFVAALALSITVVFAADDNAKLQETIKNTFADQKGQDAPRELLWPGGAPGAKGMGDDDKPTIDLYLPAKDKAAGAAVVVLPGGGYGNLAIGHEGKEIGEFFQQRGVAAFVVRYRLGSKGYRHPIMMHDAQRGIRYVRANAEKLGVKPDRIGVMGFSAGGHLASTVATHFDAGNPQAADPIDKVSCRPDFAILCYPVIDLAGPSTHVGSRKNLLGDKDSDTALIENLSNHKQVTKDTPPTFLFHTNEDGGVLADNSVMFYMACRANNVPAELHIYRTGPHGVGLAQKFDLLKGWPDLLVSWMKGLGLMEAKK